MKNKRIEPQGLKIIVLEDKPQMHVTDAGIAVAEFQLTEGIVVEFSKEFEGVYKKGDRVTFPEKAGINVMYNGKAHLYLNGNGAPVNGGDIWGIIKEEK